MLKADLFKKIQALASECHQLACSTDIGQERTELFSVYHVLHNLTRCGYAEQVGIAMNPLLKGSSDDENDDVRNGFEAWYLSHMKESAAWAKNYTLDEVTRLRGEDGEYRGYGFTRGCWVGWNARSAAMSNGAASKRDTLRSEHAQWSQATFGNVGPIGPLKHLSKEALEAAAAPDDLSEWADMQFLLWDAQRKAGFSDEQITQAMVEKLAVNKARQWPEPKDGEPRLHIATPNQRRKADCDGA